MEEDPFVLRRNSARSDFEKPFYVNADASDHSMGMVLSQMVDGKLQPVAFDSRRFKKAELNYSAWPKVYCVHGS